jgi:hypothetical protein
MLLGFDKMDLEEMDLEDMYMDTPSIHQHQQRHPVAPQIIFRNQVVETTPVTDRWNYSCYEDENDGDQVKEDPQLHLDF